MQIRLRLLIVAWLAIWSVLGLARENTIPQGDAQHGAVDWIFSADLPREARQTLTLIKDGGPFPYARDGIVFGNYEKRLPLRQRGYYHEYTVKTPGRRVAAHPPPAFAQRQLTQPVWGTDEQLKPGRQIAYPRQPFAGVETQAG